MLGSEVTVVEAMDSVLPLFDKELRRPLELFLKKNKIKVHTGVFAKGVEDAKGGKVQLNFIDKNEKDEKKMQHVIADKVLVRWAESLHQRASKPPVSPWTSVASSR